MPEDKLFFVGQKAFIEKNGEVLILISKDFGLDFPGGKIQEGEVDLNESLKREVREETGLEIEIGDIFERWSFKFRYGHNLGKEVLVVGFKCKYKSGEIKISNEHNGYKWINKNSYQELDDGSVNFKALEKYFGN